MLRILALTIFGVMLVSTGAASAACSGADPALTSVAVKSVTQANGINHYTLSGTVLNAGSEAQASDALQFVDIYQTPGEKLDAKGIPPLRPGQSYTFSYVMLRSVEAGKGTTTLRFQLDVRQPSSGMANCNTSNDVLTVTF
jgi:hypothetical protein